MGGGSGEDVFGRVESGGRRGGGGGALSSGGSLGEEVVVEDLDGFDPGVDGSANGGRKDEREYRTTCATLLSLRTLTTEASPPTASKDRMLRGRSTRAHKRVSRTTRDKAVGDEGCGSGCGLFGDGGAGEVGMRTGEGVEE